ncbi:aspartic proteinase CDR1-like [Benincasa hispida]|uniref:aspartic proteinase CDR1-like n=1 Tax=Benincasa hispida TaxID=102211 RepID=UPI001901EE40|nr:aspartic proteinase CDR1-like [Benincasa hispida]
MAPIFSLILFISSAVVSTATGRDYGFSVELIHRDSPKSPMYNPSKTHYHRLADSLRRSISRNTAALTDIAEAPIYNNQGEYLMKISVGTPPFSIIAVADTGSDITWTQCHPCKNCFHQNAPMFNPSKSTTYKKVACSSPICLFAGDSGSCSTQSLESDCVYSITYGDRSHSKGDFAVDTVTMGSTSGRGVAFPRMAIGCGHDNAGTFNVNISGIVGLGLGPASLVTQMGPATGGKFSYCLTPVGSSNIVPSKLNFGSNADVSGSKAVSTPIYTSDKFKFYSVKLEAVSVGKNKFDFPVYSVLGGKANIILDSGSTLTFLPVNLYNNFSKAISKSLNLKRTNDPEQLLDHCFVTTTDDYKLPLITMHFEGADVPLLRENVFIRVSDSVVCLAFGTHQDDDFMIFGNIAQTNFLVGYDIKNMLVSFKPMDCVAM